jgi:hypothetical protein
MDPDRPAELTGIEAFRRQRLLLVRVADDRIGIATAGDLVAAV